jgi:predicted regulator of Ras-like GTPase activity (Roadblock/LC7/MglB family)
MGEGGELLIIKEKEFRQIQVLLKKILLDSRSKVVFCVDKNGQVLCTVGDEEEYDTTALGSLAAGNIAASGGLANLIGEKEFSILFHQGENDNMHISLIGNRVILVVIFGSKTPVGLVRLKVSRECSNVIRVFDEIDAKGAELSEGDHIFEELTDEDIESIFK